jgi:hypothetical protein
MSISRKVNTIFELLEEYADLKKQLLTIRKREKKIKDKIHRLMDKNQCHKIDSDRFVCHRRFQKRETIQKSDLPTTIWQQYKKVTEFSVLSIKEK